MRLDEQTDLVDFGMHEGQPWSCVPADYLRWMISVNFRVDEANAELGRRGTAFNNVFILPRIRRRGPRIRRRQSAEVFNMPRKRA